MFKSTSNTEQFLARSGSYSTRGSRTGLDLLGIGAPEELTPAQQREALLVAHKKLVAEVIEINAKLAIRPRPPQKFTKELERRREEIGQQIKDHCTQLSQFKKDLALKTPDLGHFIIEVVREKMTRPEWAVVLKEAQRRLDGESKL